METKVKKREWVKTALIIFLAVLLVLTFFSNTIMNASLPEVAAQRVEGGQINAKIRGQGTVSANETYDVTVSQTRKVGSVLVRVGQEVSAGEVLFLLEAEESDELQQARDTLADLEMNYQKSLIDAGNAAAQDNHQVQLARDEYNEALAVYNRFSSMDADQLSVKTAAAEAELKALQREKAAADEALNAAQTDREYVQAQSDLTALAAEIDTLEKQIDELEDQLQSVRQVRTPDAIRGALLTLENDYANALMLYEADYLLLMKLSGDRSYIAEKYVENPTELSAVLAAGAYTQSAEALSEAYHALKQYYVEKAALDSELEIALHNTTIAESNKKLEEQIDDLEDDLRSARHGLSDAEDTVESFEKEIKRLTSAAASAANDCDSKQAELDDLNAAASAAETVKATRKALEELVFQNSLGDSSSLDMQRAKDNIEKQKDLIKQLTANADGQEVTAKVSGKVSAINVTAGNTVGAEMPLCTINVTDRGYVIKIPVTSDQAKKVRAGDKADLVNYWGGDVEAVLEQIVTDPQNPQGSKLLVFRLTGDVDPDQNLTLSIGQKSAFYDTLVPNSAVKQDSNGSFVLVLTAKSTPLSTRYTARRVDVQVMANDDTYSAVSGLSNGDFVITTSAKPIENGSQVRLVDE